MVLHLVPYLSHHVGAFFQDDAEADPLLQRDYQQPTGADRTVDKAQLPAVMQVKKWGLKGRTKCKNQQ